MGIRRFLTPKWVQRQVDKYKEIYRREGFKGVIKNGGWKLLLGLFMYYLIRDSFLYLVLPYLIARGFWDGCN